MILAELNRISNRQSIPKNPQAKSEPRKIRRAKAKQTRLKARSLGAAANQNIDTREIEKVIR